MIISAKYVCLFDPADNDLLEGTPETTDHRGKQVMRERPRELHVGEFHSDGAGLAGADPDREHAFAVMLLEDDHRRVGRSVQSQTLYGNLNEQRLSPLQKQTPTVRLYQYSGVRPGVLRVSSARGGHSA